MLKKKELTAQKKVDKKAKKAQVTVKAFFSWINKNLSGGIQKSRMYNWFLK